LSGIDYYPTAGFASSQLKEASTHSLMKSKIFLFKPVLNTRLLASQTYLRLYIQEKGHIRL
jgi:hypothetical protein